MSSDGGGETQQTQKTEPWEAQKDPLKRVFGEAYRQYQGLPYGTQYGPQGGVVNTIPGAAPRAGVLAGPSVAAPAYDADLSAWEEQYDAWENFQGQSEGENNFPQVAHPGSRPTAPAVTASAPTGGGFVGAPELAGGAAGGADAGQPRGSYPLSDGGVALPDGAGGYGVPGAVYGDPVEQFYGSSPQYFPGTTVSPFAPESELAFGLQTNRALAGSPVTRGASNELTRTLGGEYLDAGNPHFAGAFDPVARAVRQRIDTQFNRGEQYGSPQHEAALSTALADAAAGMAYRNYADERTNQIKGMLFAPQMAAADYQDIGQLANVGAQREDYSQALINKEIERHNFEQNREANKLAQYLGFVQGNYGGTQTGTQPYYRNRAASALGGALGGGTLGYSMGGPWGAAAGAGLGLLTGFL